MPRKSPKQARSRQTVEAILGATARILIRDGSGGLSTTRVAELAGVSIGSLYQYFPTKEALLGALVDQHIDEILGILTAATTPAPSPQEDPPLKDAIRGFVRTVLAVHAHDPELHVALTQSAAFTEGFEKMMDLTKRSRQLVESYLHRHKRDIRPKNIELAAFILVNAVQSVVSATVLDPIVSFDDEALCDELTLLVFNFLAK